MKMIQHFDDDSSLFWLKKVMAFYDEPQWAVTGDTFPVGCSPQKSIVYYETSFVDNKDLKNDKYK
jgi:inositol oxygenase